VSRHMKSAPVATFFTLNKRHRYTTPGFNVMSCLVILTNVGETIGEFLKKKCSHYFFLHKFLKSFLSLWPSMYVGDSVLFSWILHCWATNHSAYQSINQSINQSKPDGDELMQNFQLGWHCLMKPELPVEHLSSLRDAEHLVVVVTLVAETNLWSMLWSQFLSILTNFRRKVSDFLDKQCYNQYTIKYPYFGVKIANFFLFFSENIFKSIILTTRTKVILPQEWSWPLRITFCSPLCSFRTCSSLRAN
jgi:hypothetical protein